MTILKSLKSDALFTLTALMLAGLAPLSVMAAPKNITAHGAGNGGDRLKMSDDTSSGDIEIPVPENMGRAGMLEVVGVAGPGQKDIVDLWFCDSDTQGELVQFGCGAGQKKTRQIHLNAPASLLPGTYLVGFSGTFAFVQIRADEKSVLALKKLKLAKTAHPVSYSLFRDLTDQGMQDLTLKLLWTEASFKNIIQAYCESPKDEDKTTCGAWMSGNYRELLNKSYRFNDDGSISEWFTINVSVPEFRKTGWFLVTPSETTAQFISVLPGVYGVTFTDKETGKTETRYGIRAQ